MRRGLAQLLPEGHQSIEKRSCKQPDSNARPKHQNVSFSAHCRSVWGVLSLVLLTTGNVGPSSPDKVLGVLNIDLAKRVIQHLTGCRHRQQCLAKAYTSDTVCDWAVASLPSRRANT